MLRVLPSAPTVPSETKAYGPELDLLSRTTQDRALELQGQLLKAAARRTTNPRPATFTTADRVQRECIPFSHFVMQYASDCYGYPKTGVVMVVGDTSCGKTTKVLSDAGHIMLTRNAPVLYMECEGIDKMINQERMQRCMHTNPEIAKRMLANISIESPRSVDMLMPKMLDWAQLQRSGFKADDAAETQVPGLPRDIPLVIIIDPFSRLMSSAESDGNVIWDQAQKEKAHEPGTGSNFGHAKFASAFSRWLPAFCDRFGVLVIMVHHRTEKIDMSGARRVMPNTPEWKTKLQHINYIGGKALEGVASFVIGMVSTELARDPETKENTGKVVRCRTIKQSHGQGERYVQWELRTSHMHDIPGKYMEPAIVYSRGMVEVLTSNGLLGFIYDTKTGLCRSKDLGFKGLTPQQADSLIHGSPEKLKMIGELLKIPGYYDPISTLIKEVIEDAQQVFGAAPAPAENKAAMVADPTNLDMSAVLDHTQVPELVANTVELPEFIPEAEPAEEVESEEVESEEEESFGVA